MGEEGRGHALSHNYPNLSTCFQSLDNCVKRKQECERLTSTGYIFLTFPLRMHVS